MPEVDVRISKREYEIISVMVSRVTIHNNLVYVIASKMLCEDDARVAILCKLCDCYLYIHVYYC